MNKQIDFYDLKITFGGFKNTDMFTRCTISPPKTDRSIREVNCVKISSLREDINHDQTTFFLTESRLYHFYLTKVKWGLNIYRYDFFVHWQYISSHWKHKTDKKLDFQSILVLKSLLSCFRGTST